MSTIKRTKIHREIQQVRQDSYSLQPRFLDGRGNKWSRCCGLCDGACSSAPLLRLARIRPASLLLLLTCKRPEVIENASEGAPRKGEVTGKENKRGAFQLFATQFQRKTDASHSTLLAVSSDAAELVEFLGSVVTRNSSLRLRPQSVAHNCGNEHLPNASAQIPRRRLLSHCERKHVVVDSGHVECAAGALACMTLAWILILFGSWRTVDTAGDRLGPQTRNGRARSGLPSVS